VNDCDPALSSLHILNSQSAARSELSTPITAAPANVKATPKIIAANVAATPRIKAAINSTRDTLT
jgi:hypothetical protein